MKRIFLLAAVAAGAMLTSCSKEGTPSGQGEPAKLVISLASPSSATRAYDSDADDADKAINDFIIFVTKADGSFDRAPYYLSSAPGDDPIEVMATTDAAGIYVVTNTGALTTGAFASVTSLDQLKAVAMAIDGNPNTGSNVQAGNVWMGGHTETLTVGTPGSDGIPVKEAEVDLYYIAAKVLIITENNMVGAAQNTVLSGVSLINAGRYTGFVNLSETEDPNFMPAARSTAMAAPYYYNGVAITAPTQTPYFDAPTDDDDFEVNDTWKKTTGFALAIGGTTDDVLEDSDFIYAFPVDPSGAEKTWATVYGTVDADGEGTGEAVQAFWSVAFNGEDNVIKEALTASHKYMITIELKGDQSTGSGYKDDPTVETISQQLKITIKEAMWIPVSAKKIYN